MDRKNTWHDFLTRENGLFENIELIILGVAAIILGRALFAVKSARKTPEDNSNFVYGGLLFCVPFLGICREVSFGRELGLSAPFVPLIKVSLALCLLIFLASLAFIWWRKIENKLRIFGTFFTRRSSQYVYLGLGVFAISSFFEKGYLGFPHSVFLEEGFEIIAFLAILYAASIAAKSLKMNIPPSDSLAS